MKTLKAKKNATIPGLSSLIGAVMLHIQCKSAARVVRDTPRPLVHHQYCIIATYMYIHPSAASAPINEAPRQLQTRGREVV